MATQTDHNHRSRGTLWAGTAALLSGFLLIVGLLVPTTAGATSAGLAPNSIALHNDTAKAGEDCPAGGGAYWHFVLTPNNGTAAFVTITLNLRGDTVVFSGTDIIPNGAQTDNVFVAVPAGYTLTDLIKAGSSATYSGATPTLVNLSHICNGTVPTTPTTAAPTTTTTEAPTTTTEAPTTTTEAPTTTTTEAPTTTTTEAPTTTTTAADTTPTSEAVTTTTSTDTTPTSEAVTTTTSTDTTPTSEAITTTTNAASNDTTQAAPKPAAKVLSQSGTLPVTGGAQTWLLTVAALLMAGGAALLLVRRQHLAQSANK